EVGNVGGMELREPFVGDLQLHPAGWVGFEEVDVLPRNDARWNLVEQRPQREGGDDALGEAANRASRADVDGDDVQREMAVDGGRVDLDVVHSDDLAAVDVDDLLIEQVALEEQDAVRWHVVVPGGGVGIGADGRTE